MGADRDYLVELQNLGDYILYYSEIKSNIKGVIDSCKKEADRLYDTGWKGESMESFKEKFSAWSDDGNKFYENMEQIENALKAMYKNVSELKDDGGKLSNYL